MTNGPKTIEEHRDYLYKIVRLKLLFMHDRLTSHPEETPVEVLRERVDIYRKTAANTGLLNPEHIDWQAADWQEIEQGIVGRYEACRTDAGAFEEQAFAVVRPSLDARLPKDFADRSGTDGYQCGCLRHNLYDGPEETVGFHIANPLQPRSIFDDPLYLPSCFIILLDQAESRYQAHNISSGTWLNQHRQWLSMFPAEWRQQMSVPSLDVKWHYGFWGQFITARGTFNDALGAYYRTHKKFKYYPCSSQCSIKAMRQHLLTNFFAAAKI